jgi:hypothetical protein
VQYYQLLAKQRIVWDLFFRDLALATQVASVLLVFLDVGEDWFEEEQLQDWYVARVWPVRQTSWNQFQNLRRLWIFSRWAWERGPLLHHGLDLKVELL